MDVVAPLKADREPAVPRKPCPSVRSTTYLCRPNPASLRVCLLVLLSDWDRDGGPGPPLRFPLLLIYSLYRRLFPSHEDVFTVQDGVVMLIDVGRVITLTAVN
jgi:hypothetical protein